MQKAILLGSLATLSLLVCAFVSSVASSNSAFGQAAKGSVSDSVKFTQYSDENVALKAVKSGDIDAYLYRIPIELVSDAQKDPGLAVYDRDAGSFGLLMNPAPSNDSSVLNPFQFRQVRFAMNYVVDRQFTVSDILKGSGTPMSDPFGISSPEYTTIADIVESFAFRHDLSFANQTISATLKSAGATMQSGKWQFKDKPITINFFIRSDDPKRNAIGEAIASDLEKLGFTVDRIYGDLARAQLDVYGSDPQELKWQLYTEGYAGTATFVAYNPTVTAQMYAPWYGNMPGRGSSATWQYANKTLDAITQKILNLNFTSKEERTQLVRSAVQQGMQESVRIFIAQTKEPYVASSSVKWLVNDFGAGISSRFSIIDAKADGKSDLNIGVRNLAQGAWNNIEGLKDTFTITLSSPVEDPAVMYHPYLGTAIPVRTNWTDITTHGPTGSLNVSADAIKWDPFAGKWQQVGSGTTAESSVTYKILYGNWHNGIAMDKNDLLYSYYFGFQWGTNTTSNGKPYLTYDPEYTPSAAPSLPTLKGIKFTSDDTVVSYVDAWHFDSKEIASLASIWAVEPWEITAAEERLVTASKLSFSSSGAVQKGVDWLSLVNPVHAQMISDELQRMKDERYIPTALQGLVTSDEANKRYDASIKWISEHHHAVISNGPFYLDTFNAAGQTATLKAFRDDSYPFPPDYWSAKFGVPQIASVKSIDTTGPATIGKPKAVKIVVNVADQPSRDAQVLYFLSGDKGVSASGNATASANNPGVFVATMNSSVTGQLAPGAYQFKVFAIGNQAYKPAFASVPLLLMTATASGSGPGGQGNGTGSGTTAGSNTKSGCLIATAAFGSELTPQVQYLRNFRQNYILQTVSGSAFMDTFNNIYYSFSPQVADYERGQPWLQETVKASIYPLFGILMASERAHNSVRGGEAGAVLAGVTASSLIGAVYLAPPIAAYSIFRRKSVRTRWLKILAGLAASALVATVAGIMAHNSEWLSISTAAFVALTAATSAMAFGVFAIPKVASAIRLRVHASGRKRAQEF